MSNQTANHGPVQTRICPVCRTVHSGDLCPQPTATSEEIRKPRNSHFRKGSGCFECRACGKKTRENGSSNAQVQLCPKCQQQFERENSESDAS